MTSDSTGLSAPKKRKVCSSRKKAGSPRELRGEPVRGCELLSGRSHSGSCGLTRGLIVVSFGVIRSRLQDFPGVVVAVLLVVEEPPALAEGGGNLGSEQTVYGRIAVGQMPAGGLIFGVVLEAGLARTKYKTQTIEAPIPRQYNDKSDSQAWWGFCVGGLAGPDGVGRLGAGLRASPISFDRAFIRG